MTAESPVTIPGIDRRTPDFVHFFRKPPPAVCCCEGKMPDKRSPMRKITEVLRLKFEAKLGHDQIARAARPSEGVVGRYVSLTKAHTRN